MAARKHACCASACRSPDNVAHSQQDRAPQRQPRSSAVHRGGVSPPSAPALGRRSWVRPTAAVYVLGAAAARAQAWNLSALGGGSVRCPGRFSPPDFPPLHATDLNGVRLADTCFQTKGPHHVYVIGDWGGFLPPLNATSPPVPADHRGRGAAPAAADKFRHFLYGVDNCAQLRVAARMQTRAVARPPDYVLNVGDSFYWEGVEGQCGTPAFKEIYSSQWRRVFEEVYVGAGLAGKQWLGVLGNHDYGGFKFTSAWDQAIGYTWARGPPSTGRWMMPGQYWAATVRYPHFSVDYYFVDTNVYDAGQPGVNDGNMCSQGHNLRGATCGPQGPTSVDDCPWWFRRLWKAQGKWLEHQLARSTADWQVVVTHFPPTYDQDFWQRVSGRHGVDLIVTGHIHRQEVHYLPPNPFYPTAWVISGGGGGITSESNPDPKGADDEYGFMDLTLSKDEVKIEAISHGGLLRSTTKVRARNATHVTV